MQGLAAQQGKLQPAVIDAANIRLSAQHASPTTLSHATPQGLTGVILHSSQFNLYQALLRWCCSSGGLSCCGRSLGNSQDVKP